MAKFCSDEEEEKEEKVYNPRCRGELREWRQVNARNTLCSCFPSCNRVNSLAALPVPIDDLSELFFVGTGPRILLSLTTQWGHGNSVSDIWKKMYSRKKFIIFWSKTAIYVSVGPYKGRPNYRRSLQPAKGTSSTWKHKIFKFFQFHG